MSTILGGLNMRWLILACVLCFLVTGCSTHWEMSGHFVDYHSEDGVCDYIGKSLANAGLALIYVLYVTGLALGRCCGGC